MGNVVIQRLEKLERVVAGVKNAVIPADQFILGILTDVAELVVDISDRALDVGDRHDGVPIQSELLIGQFLQRLLAGGGALFQCLFRQSALGDISVRFHDPQRPALGIAMQHPYARNHNMAAISLAVYQLSCPCWPMARRSLRALGTSLLREDRSGGQGKGTANREYRFSRGDIDPFEPEEFQAATPSRP
jgi:hypothetical protein